MNFASLSCFAISPLSLTLSHTHTCTHTTCTRTWQGVYTPTGNRRWLAFVDDLNMPARSQFGFMPPLELLRLWMDTGFWCVFPGCKMKSAVGGNGDIERMINLG